MELWIVEESIAYEGPVGVYCFSSKEEAMAKGEELFPESNDEVRVRGPFKMGANVVSDYCDEEIVVKLFNP